MKKFALLFCMILLISCDKKNNAIEVEQIITEDVIEEIVEIEIEAMLSE